MTTEIHLPPKSELKLALLGHGHHLCTLMRRLTERGFPAPVVVTHPRSDHERDRQLLTDPEVYSYVFDVAAELGVEVIESKTLTDGALIARLTDMGCTAAFSCSCRSIIRGDFIRAFGGLVFNLHPSRLPLERGGGTFSWRIMNGSDEVSATLHMIDEGVDTGLLLSTRTGELNHPYPLPNHFLAATNRVYAQLIEDFLDAAEAGQPLPARPQDEDQATYLPRLHTETNGAIDWSWPIEALERFIRAFGPPYPGAFTFIGETKVAVLDAEIEPDGQIWHPYAAGRVLSRLSDGSVRVIANGGILRIRRVMVDWQESRPAELIGITDMFSTPPEILHRARSAVIAASKMAVPGGTKP
ncbi:methionyl-tRNA formyltransferase [Paramagnetospirillum caucaseum]|uniref:Methionyl-tRNA formyltransferase n=1 Tax=Paramagnetospirillum caucaseum TaxID=1244869 RepID=M3A967_9PROT|nr:formyltransferase family protein [Paramagnetospirillum caucaseum]EME69328.1 methionyl-tRNA formyltransferase [Paramagnetospirillum caucaseum]